MEKAILNLGSLNSPRLSSGKYELMIKKKKKKKLKSETYQRYEKTSHYVWKPAETTNQRFGLRKLQGFGLSDIE